MNEGQTSDNWTIPGSEMTPSLYEEAAFRAAAGNEFRPGGLRLTEELARRCRLEPGLRVLDLACGVGSTARFLARRWGVHVVGLDASASFIDEAAAYQDGDTDPGKGRIDWVVGRADDIPHPDGYFDAVFSECFLSTLEDPVRVLREVRRVLRPSGLLAVTDVYLREAIAVPLPGARPAAACLRNATDRRTMERRLDEAGFEVTTWEDHSRALGGLVASLIFEYGSADAFWQAAVGHEPAVRESVAASRPGYCLLIAQ